MSNPDCLFCKIVNKEIDAEIVHEDEQTVAFRDIHPQAKTHVQVVSREHYPTVVDAVKQEGVMDRVTKTAVRVAEQEGVVESGFRLVVNCNAGAGQSVFHLHMHVLGGRPMKWPPG